MISIKNIKAGPKTTVIGTVILVASLVAFFALEDVGMTEFIAGMVTGAAFLGIKDPRS